MYYSRDDFFSTQKKRDTGLGLAFFCIFITIHRITEVYHYTPGKFLSSKSVMYHSAHL